MSNNNTKYWSHEDLEWKNTGTHTTITEKDYEGLVWKSAYAKKGRPERTRALKRLGDWLTGTLKKKEERFHRLSVVAQEFTQRGWTVSQVIEDLEELEKYTKKSKKANRFIKDLLLKKNRSFVAKDKTNAEPLEDDKMLDWLNDWD